MSLTKQINLVFSESDVVIKMEYTPWETVMLTTRELELDIDRSDDDHRYMKDARVTEIDLSEEETRELIRSLQNLLPQGGIK
ncbi:hypothetical protein [Cytobacillus horneckiae]|uniref:hypothetical protein n=1 Tax=Cytobacillus horneckiae TaxID=549687 RepID=UPI00203EBEDC|nr:hypothetical protein [Cytobacillus horneckiae]MCM3180213.1 hypothetical protein [Cytobacillus horneckiae]